MSSKLWSVSADLLGEEDGFNLESQMEDFLLNNSKILGCWDEDKNEPTIVKKELHARKGKGFGRIDIIGLRTEGGERKILIFELKKDGIGEDAVNQLLDYLVGLKKDEANRKKVCENLLNVFNRNNIDIEEEEMNELLKKAEGILVGSKFTDTKAINLMRDKKLSGIRIMKFINKKKQEYYIITEDIIGNTLRTASISWNMLIREGVLKKEDKFYIETANSALYAYPWLEETEGVRRFIFDETSSKSILNNKAQALGRVQHNVDALGIKDLELLEKDNKTKISPTAATRLTYLTHGLPNNSTDYNNPSNRWKLCRNKYTLKKIEHDFRSKVNKV
jgi:hypothetical protein